MDTCIVAGVDIGSNAIRFLVNRVDRNQSTIDFKKVAFLRVPIRLGEDVFTKGEISEEKRIRLCSAMQGFASLLKAYKVDHYKICATSAMRDAKNGPEIVNSVLKESNLQIEIIDGQLEADMIFNAGGLDKVMNKNQNYLYVDVGGGSTEIVVFSNQKKVTSHSFQLGTVRMLVDAVDENEKKKMKEWLRKVHRPHSPLSIIGSGGNINKILKIQGKRDGESLQYTELKVLYETLKDLSFEERIENFKLNDYRADVIVPALKIFLTIAKTCKINDIYVPKVGLVDGITHYLYETHCQK